MVKREKKSGKKILIAFGLALFLVLGSFVIFIVTRISKEMSQSAISTLSESLDLLKGTVEVLFEREAQYQKLIAEELAIVEDPEKFILNYDRNSTLVKMSIVFTGESEGISNTGEVFDPEELDFSHGETVEELPISTSYINSMGTWAYTIKCPVIKEGEEIAALYVEYIYDSFEKALPDRLYNGTATLYIMDGKSERFLLKPKGIGERDAGHLNLEDFYRANDIMEARIQEEVSISMEKAENVMFYHKIRNQDSLIYMWTVNDGALYLIGYVPVSSIQREGDAVKQNIYIVVIVMLAAFFICTTVFFVYERQQNKFRREREAERETYNKQLAEALQAAQAANSSKTTFLSNMSHDIRTPMNAILGFTTLLAKDADNPAKVREYTKKLTASGQHLLSLINDVLDVSKIESGKAVLTIGEFMLNNIISSVDTIIRPAAKNKGQSFDILVTGIRHECLIGDETRLNQILINLLSNAVKYTQEGGSIWFRIIGLEQRSSQYEHIRIEVEDNGYGMTPEYLKVIFDAFTRAENSTTNKVQGTGLGMAITKNIVELMGGTIEVSSEVGKGSIFTVELELRISDQEEDSKFWEKYGVSRILVVDDDKDVCDSIQILMEDTGVLIHVRQDGETAIEAIWEAFEKNEPYNMVLLDWKMPGMNGIETAKRMQEKIQQQIPILLLTAYDWEAIEEEALKAGITGFLAKPFFVSALKEKVFEMHTREEGDVWSRGEELNLEGEHFLVAEDNEINAEILEELLEIEGATCEIMTNGQLVVERFTHANTGEFDAILMDVQMPVMNGYEATRHIRALNREDAASIPIIAMTANAFAEDVKDAINAGMNAHVSKPVDMEILKRTIKEIQRKG
ncbi:MAG: response regulator [Lachnospiraceae bacterium]|nr:response regulator [Lachnospiraceae bacterium]